MAKDSGQEGGGKRDDKSQHNGAKEGGGSRKYEDPSRDNGGKHSGGKK